jgi:hypothetical protein
MTTEKRTNYPATWRNLYLAVLSIALVAGMWLAVRSGTGSSQLERPHVPVMGFAILAVAGLAIGTRTVPYTLGLLCLLAALVGFWAASPKGGAWMAYLLQEPGFMSAGGRVVGSVSLFLFPLGWVLVAESAGSWKAGLASYLGAGVVFVCLYTWAVGEFAWSMVPLLCLFWPHFAMVMLGLFGWGPL